jgi:transcriptional regulator
MMVLRTIKWKPMHGYALVQHIQARSGDLLQVEEGSLYPALQRLLKGRLLKAEWKISPANRRVRTYSITPAGERYLEQEMSRFEQMLKGVSLVLEPVKP